MLDLTVLLGFGELRRRLRGLHPIHQDVGHNHRVPQQTLLDPGRGQQNRTLSAAADCSGKLTLSFDHSLLFIEATASCHLWFLLLKQRRTQFKRRFVLFS